VRGVSQGVASCPPKLLTTLIQFVSRKHFSRFEALRPQGSAKRVLTQRQFELLGLVAKGLTNKEIGTTLNVSEFTVKNHMRRIMKQVDVGNAIQAGFLSSS
jgi:DNA-binding NarL/FixJ family response regulator